MINIGILQKNKDLVVQMIPPKILTKILELKKYSIEKWSHAGFQKYFRNTGWMFLGKVLSMAITFVATAYIARNLGPTNYGQLSYAVSFIAIFSFISSLGIDQILYRDLVRHKEKREAIIGSAFYIKLISGTITTIFCIMLSILTSSDYLSNVLICILSFTFIFNSFQIINYEFLSISRAKYSSIITLIVSLTLNIFKILIIVRGGGVIYLSIILLSESILYALLYLYFYKKLNYSVLRWKFSRATAIGMLKDSWPLIFVSMFTLILTRVDQILIKSIINISSVGIYDSAARIAEMWYFVPNIILASLFPSIINAQISSVNDYNNRLRKITMFLVSVSILISVVMFLFSEQIINILYGIKYIEASGVLKIYSWSIIATFLSIVVNNYLIAENKRKIMIVSSILPMILNIILNLLWIPKYGIIGAAYATLISYFISPLSLIMFKNTRTVLVNIFIKR